MPAVISSELLVRLTQASPEELAAIERLLGVRARSATGEVRPPVVNSARFRFRRSGEFWEVVFEGGGVFHLKDSPGARYLEYLLHHPNVPIKAVDLEIAIAPTKAAARTMKAREEATDPEAVRAYLRDLDRLRTEREDAEAAGDLMAVAEAEGEIAKLEAALQRPGGAKDGGERARGHVRKALDVIVRRLLNGEGNMRAFGEHVRDHVSTGYECLYRQPEGRIWG